MKKYKCIIFDLDGTILDTEEMNMIPLQRLIKEELGQDINYNNLLKYRAYAGEMALEELGFIDVKKSYIKWVQYVNEYEKGAKLYDGFSEVIKILNEKGIICAIASSKTKKQYEIDFFKTGLQEYMKSVVLAEDTKRHKPHPDPILKAIEILDIKPEDSIYIGDTIFDLRASKAANIDFALVQWSGANASKIEADYYLKEPVDILKLLKIG